MKRHVTMLLLIVALLTASCGLKINMPTLGIIELHAAVADASRESAR
jgi:uncharacterized membrane protein